MKLYWGCRAAGALIFCPTTGRFLLVQRSERVFEPFVWGIPGGRVEPDESYAAGCWREIQEELGDLGGGRVRLGEVIHTFTDLDTYAAAGFTFCTFLAVTDSEFRPTLNYENTQYRWFSLEQILNLPVGEYRGNLHPNVRDSVLALRPVIC